MEIKFFLRKSITSRGPQGLVRVPENKFIAQDVLSHRAKMNKLAALGEWNSELEDQIYKNLTYFSRI